MIIFFGPVGRPWLKLAIARYVIERKWFEQTTSSSKFSSTLYSLCDCQREQVGDDWSTYFLCLCFVYHTLDRPRLCIIRCVRDRI